jgi:cytochrome c oxidase subunit 4
MTTCRTYILVWISLLVLTVANWYVSYLNLGSSMHVVVALIVASLNASLIAMFFMGLRNEKKLVLMFALFPLAFLFLIIAGTVADFLSRG